MEIIDMEIIANPIPLRVNDFPEKLLFLTAVGKSNPRKLSVSSLIV
jgi:hypothetical protein